MMSEQELWQHALVQIELDVPEASFKTWFRNTDITKREGGDVYIAVPSRIVKDWLYDKHHKRILRTLRSIDEGVRAVHYVVHRSVGRQAIKRSTDTGVATHTLAMQEVYIDKRDNLNPRYTFETFVVGPFNQLAHAAAQAVMNNPGLAYNPLFIYGRTGHGKTHLIQAIGNHFKKTNPNKKVFYVTSERFRNDFVQAIRMGKADSFKNQFRQYDVLIMDDIQFVTDSEKTQEELFHLFNALHDNNRQIIFSSDKHPAQMSGFEDRLKGRFSAGMIAEIPAPDVESRIAIINAKIEQQNFSISKEIVQYVSENVQGNIRELEGILNSIVCKMQVKGKPLSQQEVHTIFKNSIRPQKGMPAEEVVRRIAQFYEIDERSIYEKTRKKEIVKPRQIIMYILREEFRVSYPSIGEKLGGRDHTTVIHSCEKIKNQLKNDSALEQEIDHVKNIINS